MNIVLSSKAPKECFDALEKLLFFNPRQHLVRDGILDSLAQFGQPRLERLADGLSVRMGEIEAQTLFAFDQDRAGSEPVGVLDFFRTMPMRWPSCMSPCIPITPCKDNRPALGSGGIGREAEGNLFPDCRCPADCFSCPAGSGDPALSGAGIKLCDTQFPVKVSACGCVPVRLDDAASIVWLRNLEDVKGKVGDSAHRHRPGRRRG